MKRINILLPLGILILALIAFSCKRDEQPSVGFMMKATDTEAPTPSDDFSLPGSSEDENLPLSWNIAWIYITHLDFRAEYFGFSDLLGKHQYPDVHIEWQGNQKIDLLARPITFGHIELPEGNFKQFELTMTSERFGVVDEPNFYLSGMFGPAFGGTPISVSVTQEFDMELNYNGEDDISTNDTFIFEGLITLSIDQVFAGISTEDLEKAVLTDGWILISAEHNQDLYAKILENLHIVSENTATWRLHSIN